MLTIQYKPVDAQSRLKIMLLGDSYTAGNGARNDDGATDNFGPKGCYRSNSNWGQQYVNQLNEVGVNATLINRACSGSVTNDLLYDNDMEQDGLWIQNPEAYGVNASDSDDTIISKLVNQVYCPKREAGEEYYRINILEKTDTKLKFECRRYIKAQLESVDDSVDLVLMTMGGNDIKFSDIVMGCFAPILSSPTKCENTYDESDDAAKSIGTGSYQSNMQSIIAKLQSKLRSDAKVVLLNYPYLAKDDNFILKDAFGSSSYEASKFVRELGRLGDTVQANLIPASQPGKAKIYYFDDLKDHFEGHEPDMSDFWHNNSDKWINTFGSRLPTDWFHFNPTGHKEVANDLYQKLESYIGEFPAKNKKDYDVVFIYNESGDADSYNLDDLGIKGITIGKIRDKILSVSNTARFGIIGYNLWTGSAGRTGDKYALKQDFTSDIIQLARRMPRPSNQTGLTMPGTLKQSIETALAMKWRPGVKKLIYIIGKTTKDDDVFEDTYYKDVIQKSLALDPVAISSIMAAKTYGTADTQADKLAAETGGIVVSSAKPKDYSSNYVATQTNNSTISTPYAWAGEGVTGRVGDNISFDASGSYDQNGISSYEWDIDNDGEFDITATDPKAGHIYKNEYKGLVVLKVNSYQGTSALASISANITKDGDVIDDETDNCPLDWNEDQADADGDGVGDVCDESPGIVGYKPEQDPPPADAGTELAPREYQSENDLSYKKGLTDVSESSTDTAKVKSAFLDKQEVDLNRQPKKISEFPNKTKNYEKEQKNLFKNENLSNNNPRFNWLIIAGTVTGVGAAAYILNANLFEEEEV
jgi:lysophospholipase L1-like esterase